MICEKFTKISVLALKVVKNALKTAKNGDFLSPIFPQRQENGVKPEDLPQILVPLAGLEPARSFDRGILSPLRLPIPPQRRLKMLNFHKND